MNILLSWLADFVTIDRPVPALADLLTETGLKVESVHSTGVSIDKIVVARILDSQQHPNADRLSVCKVDDGSGTPRQIVCGAKNYKVGDLVPLALPGAVLPGGFKIKSGKLRGELSEGMMCSRAELELPGDASGLWILPASLEVGKPLSEALPSETVIELEITPNRPDWLSHAGVAREVSAFLKTPLRLELPVPPAGVEDPSVARIAPGAACPFYSLRRIRGVRIAPSPDWLRERLERVGLRPINNVVDITNYVLMELGQPLHAFDAAKVSGGINVRPATDGEHFVGLDGTETKLEAGHTVIADDNGALAVAGVIGGRDSGVTETTTDILLESALFEPSAIRRTSRRTGISTDSSYRFERGADRDMVLAASERAVRLILELAGGVADDLVFTAGSLPSAPNPVTLRHERVRSLLGADFSDSEIREFLSRAGLREEPRTEPGVSRWVAPGFRIDLLREVDLVEEVARLAGIARIPSKVTAFPAPGTDADREYDLAAGLRAKLVHAGFFEAKTSTLVSEAAAGSAVDTSLRLKNPLGADQSFLRPSPVPALLDCLRANFHHGAASVCLFEIGSRFSAGVPEQSPVLALLAGGSSAGPHWQMPSPPPIDFFAFAGVIESIFPGPPAFEPAERGGFALAVEIRHNGTACGWAGILSPAGSRSLDATSDVFVAEIDLAPLYQLLLRPPSGVRPVPKFPAVTRDLAVVVERSTPFAKVRSAIHDSGGPCLVKVFPFDLFTDPEGKKLAADKKSLAVSLTFQSLEKTLESSEVDAAIDRIRKELQSRLSATFRE